MTTPYLLFLELYLIMTYSLCVSLQLQQAKQTVKVDNPAHLDSISSCIERCRKLQKIGVKVRFMKPKHQVLQDIQDDLKWMSQISGRSTLNRSHTTVEDKRAKKKSFRIRRTSVMTIKEEVAFEDAAPTAATLPRDVALNVARRNEGRPQFLGISRSASVNVGSTSTSRLERQSFSPPSTLPSKKGGKVSTLKRSSKIKKHPFFAEEDEHTPEELLPRKHRSPNLAGIGKSSSSMDYAGDDEEADVVIPSGANSSPSRKYTKSYILKEPESLVISNSGKTSSSSPFQRKKMVSFEQDMGAQTLVAVEVHCNDDASEPESRSHDQPPPPPPVDPNMVRQVDLETSVTSQTRLLPDKDDGSPRRKRAKSPSFKKKSSSVEKDWLIEHQDGNGAPYFAWEEQDSRGVGGSYSLPGSGNKASHGQKGRQNQQLLAEHSD